jgi:hypothetical protein
MASAHTLVERLLAALFDSSCGSKQGVSSYSRGLHVVYLLLCISLHMQLCGEVMPSSIGLHDR